VILTIFNGCQWDHACDETSSSVEEEENYSIYLIISISYFILAFSELTN